MAADTASSPGTPVTFEKDGWSGQSATLGVTADQAPALAASLTEAPAVVDPPTDPAASAPTSTDPPAVDPAARSTDPPKPKPDRGTKRVEKIQAQIDALTKAREDARRAFEADEAERVKARAARADAPPPKADASHPTAAAAEPTEPTWEDYDAQGKTFGEFQKDLTKFIKAQAVQEAKASLHQDLETRDQTQRAEARAHAWTTKVDAVRAQHADFDAVVGEISELEMPFVNLLTQFHAKGPEIFYELGQQPELAAALVDFRPTRPMADALRFSEQPTALLLHLASLGPAELARLARLHPAAQIRALSVLEAQVTGATDGSPAPPRVTQANPPIEPVGPGTRVAGDPVPLTQERDFAKFFKRANADEARRRSA